MDKREIEALHEQLVAQLPALMDMGRRYVEIFDAAARALAKIKIVPR